MKVYIFGNQDLVEDNNAFKVADYLGKEFSEFEKIIVRPNEDLPFDDKETVILLDTVQGLETPTLLTEDTLPKIVLSKSLTAHDFDLAFQLKYLKKLGKLGKFFIIGIPQKSDIDYFSIQSIFKKLVAQDMHGS